MAILLLAHERKGGGEIGESGRGSSAFAGAVDTILQLQREKGQGSPERRVLKAMSRLDGVPPYLVIERRIVNTADAAMANIGVPAESIFVLVANNRATVKATDDAAIVDALPTAHTSALSMKELEALLGLSRRPCRRSWEHCWGAGCSTGGGWYQARPVPLLPK